MLTPKDDTVIRPTTDFIREALFNILSTDIVGAIVLDLFGGTGALSLESMSRGAKSVTVCDKAKESLDLIRKNAQALGETLEICQGDYDPVLKRLAGRQYDIVFLDPPYKMEIAPVLACLAQRGLVAPTGLVVYEHDKSNEYTPSDPWDRVDERHYGRVALTFLTIKTASLSDDMQER